MIIIEPILPKDLLSLDITNLDKKTENYSFSYYMQYFIFHPYDFYSVRSFSSRCDSISSMIYTNPVLGYVLGRREVKEKVCLHLSGLSVSPALRKFKIGTQLMKIFEMNGNSYKTWFIDLFVRKSNPTAISFYRKLGYVIYRTVFNYYISPNDDAYDMRKSLAIDIGKECEVPDKDIQSYELEQ